MSDKIPIHLGGIIFDLDGTLYHMKWYFKPIFTIMLLPQSLLLPRYMSLRKKYAGKEHDSGASLLTALAEDLAILNGRGNSKQMHQWINQKFYRAFQNTMPFLRGSRPGLNNLLKRLGEKGIKLGVLSDFDRVSQRLRGLGIAPELFDTISSSESSGCLKPSPRGFLSIAEKWQTAPSRILVIGDRADTDGLGAKNAGMHFIRISDSLFKKPQALSWKQIRALLESHIA